MCVYIHLYTHPRYTFTHAKKLENFNWIKNENILLQSVSQHSYTQTSKYYVL